MLALIYKLVCIAAAAIGLVVAFPLITYAFILGVSNLTNGGILILLAVIAPAIAAAWGILRSAFDLKSRAASSFIVPTIAGALGVAFAAVGLPFAENPPGYESNSCASFAA